MSYKFKADYDFEEDTLYFFDEEKKSKGSVEFGELIIDLKKEGNIVGLELFNASRYLSELTNRKITKENLKKIEGADFSTTAKKGIILIRIVFLVRKKQVPATIAIQNMHYKSPALAH